MIGKGEPVGFGFEEGVGLVRSDSEALYHGAQSKTRKTLLLLLQIIMLLVICRTRPCLLFGEHLSLNAVHIKPDSIGTRIPKAPRSGSQ
jgi:hypothetical protein